MMERLLYISSTLEVKRWIDALITRYKNVFAPVKDGSEIKFGKLSHSGNVVFEYTSTVLPPKKFFLPPCEIIFEYKDGAINKPQDFEPSVIFGIHSCDIAAIHMLDRVMKDGVVNEGYFNRRNAILIGINCIPDSHCFCNAFNDLPKGDLFLTLVNDNVFIEVISLEGSKLLELFPSLRKPDRQELDSFHSFLRARERMFSHNFECDYEKTFSQNANNRIWEELAKRCLSCAGCTSVCPTCYCFDVFDYIDFDGRVSRFVKWDSCQKRSFTRVASGEVFRDNRADRVRHRFFRKFVYLKKRYGMYYCTGCGRCGRYCPTGINIPEVVERLNAVKSV